MEKTLKLWIAQSESWHTFVDFRLPEEDIAKYPFLERKDDFFISLLAKLFDLFNDPDVGNKKDELLAVGKGLEIYSLENTRKHFKGVNYFENILFAASLYYLANYSASAWILANFFGLEKYDTDINKFISSFLRRDVHTDNSYVIQLREYLNSGQQNLLTSLKESLIKKSEESIKTSPYEYTSYKLAASLVNRFNKDNIWVDLLKQDSCSQEIWKKYVEANLKKEPPVWDFFPSQKEAISKGILKDNKTFSFQMPTSAGKTALCELLIYHEKVKKPTSKILFLAPYRALASELKAGFSKKLAQLGIKSKTIYGGNITTQNEKKAIHEVDLLISTPEKFMAIESVIPNIFELFQMIICDEGHLLDNAQRGLSYELLLSKFVSKVTEGKRFIFLSAIIPNLEEINSWLGGNQDSLITSDYRPTELNFAFLEKSSKSSFTLNVNPTSKEARKLSHLQIFNRKRFLIYQPSNKQKENICLFYTKNKIRGCSFKSSTFWNRCTICSSEGQEWCFWFM